jgi:hypothetical protein
MATMNAWSVVLAEDESGGFRAPELMPRLLKGRVYGHPRFTDGEPITSSPIVSAVGRMVTTATGTVFELQEPSPDYVSWLVEQGREIDPENPIRIFE